MGSRRKNLVILFVVITFILQMIMAGFIHMTELAAYQAGFITLILLVVFECIGIYLIWKNAPAAPFVLIPCGIITIALGFILNLPAFNTMTYRMDDVTKTISASVNPWIFLLMGSLLILAAYIVFTEQKRALSPGQE